MNTLGFYNGKKVFVTGHTGFKGSWLCLWLKMLGARVTGYALKPEGKDSLFDVCSIGSLVSSHEGDVRDREHMKAVIKKARPEVVLHLAAQALVRDSYLDPIGTFETNAIGTVNLLDICRSVSSARSIIVVTSDKSYAQDGKQKSFKEEDAVGGNDPYSASKGCTELITHSYKRSFYHSRGLATARAGNVIGGGDWAKDRLIPDCMRAFKIGKKVSIRYPNAIRPWQHVLEALWGYLILGERLYRFPEKFSGPWNFGPAARDVWAVREVVQLLSKQWGDGASWAREKAPRFHEEPFLRLDSAKSRKLLGWRPAFGVPVALRKTLEWYRAYWRGEDMQEVSFRQIQELSNSL